MKYESVNKTEACKLLGCSRNTVYNRIASGHLDLDKNGLVIMNRKFQNFKKHQGRKAK